MLFLILVFAINLAVNLYIFSRTRTLFPEAGSTSRIIAIIIFWLIAFAYFAGRMTERSGFPEFALPFIKIGSWWLGAMVYLTLLFLMVDILRGFNGIFNISELLSFPWAGSKGKTVAILVYSLSAVILVWGYFNAASPKVNRVPVHISKTVPGGKQKIVLVSDIHLGVMVSDGSLRKLVDLVNREKADLVLLAGDVFDEDLGPVIEKNMGDILKNLEARQGVYAVLGNHEFYGNAGVAQKYLEIHRVTVLRDSAVVLGNGISIVGREDITAGRMSGQSRKTLGELLSGIDAENPVILLDHQPYNLAEVALYPVDLQVSGHTHHGQMWPFNYITRGIFEISKGYGKIRNTHFYVSSGYGTWGPPVRTSSRPEIAVLEVHGSNEQNVD